MLFFFTTLNVKPKWILALYKLRWNIETDLRSLKRTVDLHQVTSKSQAMVEKEILMAICATTWSALCSTYLPPAPA
jgi:transposase